MDGTDVIGPIIFIQCQQKPGLSGAKIGREISNNDPASVKPEFRSGQQKVAATPRRHRVIATPPSHFFRQRHNRRRTGDEGVACTFLRRGVAATLKPAS
jgi:hypothetical protein